MPALATQNSSYRTPASVIWSIIGISALASLALAWIVYFHAPIDATGKHLAFLPAVDAILNGICTIFLIFGFRFIRRGNITAHRNSMFGAFIASCAFIVAYVTNHVLHGDILFPKAYPTARAIYLWVLLIPHIFIATICLPLILITFFLSLTGRFPIHRRVARWTWPLWLYVSISGVILYAMLAAYR